MDWQQNIVSGTKWNWKKGLSGPLALSLTRYVNFLQEYESRGDWPQSEKQHLLSMIPSERKKLLLSRSDLCGDEVTQTRVSSDHSSYWIQSNIWRRGREESDCSCRNPRGIVCSAGPVSTSQNQPYVYLLEKNTEWTPWYQLVFWATQI